MKQFFTSLIMCFVSLTAMAQGWPADYNGVMLQGFYWDSYTDTKWTNLESQADELSQFFNLIWVPQSGYCNTTTNQMGYSDIWWLDHKSAFGTESQLRSMIATFKSKNVGIIEDVVINHKNGNTSWCDFPNESKNGYTLTWDNTNFSGICQDDECNNATNLSKWSTGGKKATGAKDTGDNFDGCRDLDHTNATVQQNIKTYLDFLLKDLGYAGFRYDMVKGYAPKYTGIYNTSANPTYSVGEYWDGDVTKVKGWIDGTGKTSAAFDFPLKYKLNAAFDGRQWSLLKESVLANNTGYARYAVTFVDNHDTYREGTRLNYNVCAANAYILTMPGTPCLFLPHWQAYKGTLKRLIQARKAAGITNQSTITEANASTNGFILKVKGTKGTLLLVLDKAVATTAGYQLAVEGVGFKLYVSDGTDLSAINAITDSDAQQETTTVPAFCKVNDGETCAFFEVPAYWNMTSTQKVKCWRWDKQYNYTGGTWPGVECTKVGTAPNGNAVWKWTYKESQKKTASGNTNEGIIFNNGVSTIQTDNLVFENGGYYTMNGAWKNVIEEATAIEEIPYNISQRSNTHWYDLRGHRLDGKPTRKGIYIYQGKKFHLR